MYEIITNFRLQLCIDMVLNQPFWYLSKVLLVFLVFSCRKTHRSLKFLLNYCPNTSLKVLQSTVVSMIPRLRRTRHAQFSRSPSRTTGNPHFFRKQLVREMRKTNLFEFSREHLELTVVYLFKISCSLV